MFERFFYSVLFIVSFQSTKLSFFLSTSLWTSINHVLMIISCSSHTPCRPGGVMAYLNAEDPRSYRLINKQKYVGHGRSCFVTQ